MPIFFCGDTAIDNYEFYGELKPLLPQYDDWSAPSKITVRRFGGVHLLALFTTFAWSLLYGPEKSRRGPITGLQPAGDFYKNELLSREIELYRNQQKYDHYWQFSYQLAKYGNEYRVIPRIPAGVTPPTDAKNPPHVVGKKELRLDTESDAKLFVINYRKPHASEEFHRTIQAAHKKIASDIAAEADAWVIIKVRDAPKTSDNVPLLSAKNPETAITVIQADEFRKLGMPISRSLSWESTLRDIIKLVRAGGLLPGNLSSHLIITFDYDAVLYLRTSLESGNTHKRVVENGVLVFSVEGAEGDFESRIEGDAPGAQTVFVSMLSTLLYKELASAAKDKGTRRYPLKSVDRMLECSLVAKRRFLQSGFVILDEDERPRSRQQANSVIPTISYSEGIFSLQKKPPRRGDRSSEPPNPLIDSEDLRKHREFLDPLDPKTDLKPTLSDHGLATYIFQKDEIPGDDWPADWSIFRKVNDLKKARSPSDRKDISEGASEPAQYVFKGGTPKEVPVCSFGDIRTVDVREIEDFRTIANLLQAYLSTPSQSKPLGIAVFGSPGTGKSFAVKNIVKTLPKKINELTKDNRLECNLTALGDPEGLAHYFQLARNSVLRGKIPMLFFDEFDCTVGSSRFFWLKHFLAPLQDGEFRSGQIVHPIGRVIFVFAGSVCDTFAKFAKEMEDNKNAAEKNKTAVKKHKRDKTAPENAKQPIVVEPNFKGVDFLSRLHGHIDVVDFTPKENKPFYYTRKGDKEQILIDPSYLMRRAFVLRSLLEQYLGQIFTHGSPREAKIDTKIVNALLATKTFRHGVRSMESILRMSYLEGGNRFEISHLPPNKQLEMHVDTKNFDYCLGRNIDKLWREAAEQSATLPA